MAATAGWGKYHTGGYGRIGVYRVKPNLVFCNMELFGPVGPAENVAIAHLLPYLFQIPGSVPAVSKGGSGVGFLGVRSPLIWEPHTS